MPLRREALCTINGVIGARDNRRNVSLAGQARTGRTGVEARGLVMAHLER